MSTLSDLARWAAQLDPSMIPTDLRQRALLQHLSCAAALRLSLATDVKGGLLTGAGTRGKVPTVALGRKLSRRDALRMHAGGIAAWDYADSLFWASAGPGAVGTAWSLAGDHSLDQLLTATLAANEVSARLGASGLFAPASGLAWGSVQAIAAATVAGRLAQVDAATLERAYSLALAMAGDASLSDMATSAHARAGHASRAVEAGVHALDLARGGAGGNSDALDHDEWYGARGCLLPLRKAFTGLGSCWFTRSLAFKTSPISLHLATGLQALEEILSRHITAADKRLRPDQWTEAVLRLPWSSWVTEQLGRPDRHGASWSLRTQYALLSLTHEIGANELSESFWDERGGQIREQIAKVRVEHAWEHSLASVEALLRNAGPLLSDVGVRDLRRVSASLRHGAPFPGAPGRGDLLALAKARPDRLAGLLDRHAGGIESWDAGDWRYELPMDVKVHTTRGGFWPEVRGFLECGPGWSWEDTVERVQVKFAAGDEERAAAAPQLLLASGSQLASEWLEAL